MRFFVKLRKQEPQSGSLLALVQFGFINSHNLRFFLLEQQENQKKGSTHLPILPGHLNSQLGSLTKTTLRRELIIMV